MILFVSALTVGAVVVSQFKISRWWWLALVLGGALLSVAIVTSITS